MPWTFFGIELASRALQAMQMAMNTAGHNLANINTPGYSRQRVNLAATEPLLLEGVRTLFVGSGVRVDSIQRIRDTFLDARIAASSSQYQQFLNLYGRLTQVEDVFSEPTNAGLSRQLVAFFNAFHELSSNPENVGVRASLAQTVEGLIRTFRQLASRLDEMFYELQDRVEVSASEINSLAKSIADLNAKIRFHKALGAIPNDLLDTRAVLIEKLAEYVEVRVVEKPDGTVRLTMDDFALVDGEVSATVPHRIDYMNKSYVDDISAPTIRVRVLSGSVRGWMDAMQYIRQYRQQLDTLAREFVENVNEIHRTGYGLDGQTNRNLLAGTDATNISISNDMLRDGNIEINRIAAGASPAPGDGAKALEMARLRQTPIADLGMKTIPDFYSATVAQLGQHTRAARSGQENQKIILQNLQASREAVSGVNMDEELANLLRYQRSYQAAAQLVAVMDTVIADMLTAFARRG